MTRRGTVPVPGRWTASPPEGFDPGALGLNGAWTLLLAARRVGVRTGGATAGWSLNLDGRIRRRSGGRAADRTGEGAAPPPLLTGEGDGWRPAPALEAVPAAVRDFLAPYLPALAPLTEPRGRFVVAHLGQSVDGCIASASGHAIHVTGEQNLAHLHRLRALCDAVLLGAGSVAADDPRLTVRLVEGDSPTRVVLDPDRRLATPRRVFDDGAAPTVVVSLPGSADAFDGAANDVGRAARLGVPADPAGGLDLAALLDALAARGLRRAFVEGGGVTVTRFVEAGLVDRLHVAIAPVLIGRGVPGLRLAPAETMLEARRPPARLHLMGEDVLWDFDLTGGTQRGAPEDGPPEGGSASTS